METNSIGSVTITRPVASGSSHNDAPWEKPSQDSVGHILHHCWHWSGHLRDTRILLTLVRAPAGYPHHCWGHLQGTRTTADTGQGSCGVPAPLLTLVRAHAGYLHTPDTSRRTCGIPAPLLTLVMAPAGYLRHCRQLFCREDTNNYNSAIRSLHTVPASTRKGLTEEPKSITGTDSLNTIVNGSSAPPKLTDLLGSFILVLIL